MDCLLERDWPMIHKQMHICECAMDVSREARGVSKEQETAELAKQLDKMMDAMAPLTRDVPKYRVGMCYYSLLQAFCKLLEEDNAELAKAEKHAERFGFN